MSAPLHAVALAATGRWAGSGAAPTVVLLHPGPALDGSVFLPGAERLRERGAGLLLLDLPGSGQSPDPVGPDAWTLRGHARAIADAIAAAGIADPVVLGHSFGGYVAAQLLVDGLPARGWILSCTDVDEQPPPEAPEDPLAGLPPAVAARFTAAEEREATVADGPGCRAIWEDELPVLCHDVAAGLRMLERVAWRPAPFHDRDWGELDALGALAATAAPVLAIGGEHDRVTPPACARRIAATAPRGTLALLDSGHFPFVEAAAAYWDAVAGWLERLG
ncbi:alpha/beta fold hydrolase [Patulibacter defluvii]|uniref:alpha/beta fold hydrolase n=1 Tax=Patulibacter defluvii TaxID=3095358 RepID=UPI002A74F4FD|nr:alpha/beta fold hydrolase [Patulibacter sp. DM4]